MIIPVETNLEDLIDVRDLRTENYFRIENELVDHWAKHIGWKAVIVYIVLCRYAGIGFKCYPSLKTLCEHTGLSKPTIIEAINILDEWLIIDIEKKTENGKKLVNTYYLLDSSSWDTKSLIQLSNSQPRLPGVVSHVDIKNNISSKEDINRERTTETKANVGEPKLYSLQGSSNYLLKIPPEDVKALTDKFIATEQDVREKGEDLYAWLMTKGTKRDNYKFFLIQCFRKDFKKRLQPGYVGHEPGYRTIT